VTTSQNTHTYLINAFYPLIFFPHASNHTLNSTIMTLQIHIKNNFGPTLKEN